MAARNLQGREWGVMGWGCAVHVSMHASIHVRLGSGLAQRLNASLVRARGAEAASLNPFQPPACLDGHAEA